MSPDPHAPTPAGPDPDERTEVHPVVDEAATEPTPIASTSIDPVEPPAEDPPAEDPPAVEATPAAPEDDWLKPDADTSPATPAPDPIITTPSAFTPPGTPEDGSPSPTDKAQALGEQAKTLTDRPEVMVGLAFVGGAVVSFVLKRFGR